MESVHFRCCLLYFSSPVLYLLLFHPYPRLSCCIPSYPIPSQSSTVSSSLLCCPLPPYLVLSHPIHLCPVLSCPAVFCRLVSFRNLYDLLCFFDNFSCVTRFRFHPSFGTSVCFSVPDSVRVLFLTLCT